MKKFERFVGHRGSESTRIRFGVKISIYNDTFPVEPSDAMFAVPRPGKPRRPAQNR
jgi:hypothetical protein